MANKGLGIVVIGAALLWASRSRDAGAADVAPGDGVTLPEAEVKALVG